MMFPNKIGLEQFEEKILKNELPTMVFFHTWWCKECRGVLPEVRKCMVGNEGKLEIFSMDVNDCDKFCDEIKIIAIPTFIFYLEGKDIRRRIGGVHQFSSFFINVMEEISNT